MGTRIQLGSSMTVVLRSKSRKILGVYDAVGGPEVGEMGGDGHPRGQTPAGRFFVAYRKKHISPSRYPLSKIAWGTKLRKNKQGEYEAETSPGRWESVRYLTGIETHEITEMNFKVSGKREVPKTWIFMERDSDGNIDPEGRWNFIPPHTPIKIVGGVPKVTINGETITVKQATGFPASIVDKYHDDLFKNSSFAPNGWSLNDFGHITVYMYSDKNGNQKLDPDMEKVKGEMFHTTPENEVQAMRRKKNSAIKVVLDESHGCIHMDPDQFDEMINAGYFDNNNEINIYKYTEDMPDIKSLGGIQKGGRPYAVHFFPKSKKIIVTGS